MRESDGKNRSKLLVLVCLLLVIAVVLGVYYTYSGSAQPDKSDGAVILTNANFESSVKSGVYLVDFWADWCGPCKMQEPIINEIANDFSGKVTVAKVDIDANAELLQLYSISAIPTIIIFKDGEVNKRLVGVQNRETLKAALDAAL
jgi:thioredoxin